MDEDDLEVSRPTDPFRASYRTAVAQENSNETSFTQWIRSGDAKREFKRWAKKQKGFADGDFAPGTFVQGFGNSMAGSSSFTSTSETSSTSTSSTSTSSTSEDEVDSIYDIDEEKKPKSQTKKWMKFW